MIHLLADQAIATVQVIGLAVVMSANPNPGIDVVMPRVKSMHVPSQTTQMMRTSSSPKVEPAQMIDDHVPIILFPTAALRERKGWEPKLFKPLDNDGYSYVTLDGEHLHFVVNGDNPVATVPNLPRLSWGCSDTSATSLKGNGRTIKRQYKPVLNDSYKPPEYPLAGAVLNVPKGQTNACLAVVQGEKRGRVDTRIFLVNDGTITIEGKKKDGPLQSLSFWGDTLVIVANVPINFLQNTTAGLDVGHFGAYYSMLDAAAATNCQRQPTPAGLTACDISTNIRLDMTTTQPANVTLPSSLPFHLMTYECSNSQYP